MHIKAKALHFIYAKKLKIVQIKKKAFGVSLNGHAQIWCMQHMWAR